jgi:predicted esterase
MTMQALRLIAAGWLVLASAGARADEYAALQQWFSQPGATRGPVPSNADRVLANAEAAKAAAQKVWEAYKAGAVSQGLDKELPAIPPTLEEIKAMPAGERPKPTRATLTEAGKEMPFLLLAKGAPGSNGWPLFISLHGGGKSGEKVQPHGWRVNSQEWQAQVQLFSALYPSGLYFIPRMADDNDGRWALDYCQAIYDRVIRDAILFRNVDPNRVFLQGISEGGYTAYRLGAHMADRWAGSCAMAAAEPFSTSPPENFRNLPFCCSIGENDRMFDRINLARKYFARLSELQQADGSTNAYLHLFDEQKERGHGIDYRPGPEWIAKYVRDPWPRRVVWTVQRQNGTLRNQMYWLALQAPPKQLPLYLDARIAGNEVSLIAQQQDATGSRVPASGVALRIYLNDHLANLDQPVKVSVNGKRVHDGKVTRSLATLARSLNERGDPCFMFPVEIPVRL